MVAGMFGEKIDANQFKDSPDDLENEDQNSQINEDDPDVW